MATTDDELLDLEREIESLREAREELSAVPVNAAEEDARDKRKEQLLRERDALKAEVEWAAAAASGEVIVAQPRDKSADPAPEPEAGSEPVVASGRDVDAASTGATKPADAASAAVKVAEKAAEKAKSTAESAAAAKPAAGEEK